MEISFCSHPNTNKVIATIFGTWHDSWAVVACAKFCCDMVISNWIRAKWNVHRIWIVMEKSLMKWAPGQWKGPRYISGTITGQSYIWCVLVFPCSTPPPPPIQIIYLSPPSAVYMRQWSGSALVQVMACRLNGAKPLPEPMLTCCPLDSWKQTSVKFESEFYHFHSRKCIWNCRLPKWRPFGPGGDELIYFSGRLRIHHAMTIYHAGSVNYEL